MLLPLFLLACTPEPLLEADALSQIDDMRSLVTAHRQAVDGAGSMDDVAGMETDHADQMAIMMGDMESKMSSMMGCSADAAMMGSMTDAEGHLSDMMDDVHAHSASHASHADMQACTDEEDGYGAMMDEHFDAMSGDMDGFDAHADCSGGGGMMM